MKELKAAFNNLISFLSSSNVLIIAFTIKILWMPDACSVAGLTGALSYLLYAKFVEHRIKLKKMDMEQQTNLDNAQIKTMLETLHNAQTATAERLTAFETHKVINSATMPNGVFNFDPNFMRE